MEKKQQEKTVEKGFFVFLQCMVLGSLAIVAAVPVAIIDAIRA